jgi:hypothetical protein
MKRIIVTILIWMMAASSSATIINIPADWPTIQQGINATVPGDTVLVQPGTYYENINFSGRNIVLGSLYLTSGDESYISSTIICGHTGVTVIFDSGSYYSKLTGFTVTAHPPGPIQGITCFNSRPTIYRNIIINYDILPSGYNGAAIYCSNDARPIISHNIIENNCARLGGAIYCRDSNPLIYGNVIVDNVANGGGGIFSSYSQSLIIGNFISGNLSNEGGGIELYGDSGSVIINNLIHNNTAGLGGGIILGRRSSFPIIKNNIIAGNYAGHQGGGIYIGSHCHHLFIENNTIFNNYADTGGGIAYWNYYISLIKNMILWGNSAIEGPEIYTYHSGHIAVKFSDIEGGWPGEGNIDVDPLFRDPDNGDFHLMSIACGDTLDSPCIDAGDPDILDSLLDCSWGLGGPRSDMGAYGGGDSLITGIFDNMPSIPDRFMLLQNYPNPFNAQTTIRFILPEPQDVELTVYDLLGRRVEILLDEYRQAGVHAVRFDASDYPSGIFFARLETENATKSIKMLLLK